MIGIFLGGLVLPGLAEPQSAQAGGVRVDLRIVSGVTSGPLRFQDGRLRYQPGAPGVQILESPRLGRFEGASVEQRFPYWMGVYDWPWPYDPLGPYYDPFWRDPLADPYGPCPHP